MISVAAWSLETRLMPQAQTLLATRQFDEERCFDRAVISPEPHGVPGDVNRSDYGSESRS